MTAFLAAVLALGVAGLDPIGALLVAGAVAGGATRAGVWAFTASAAVTTIAVGTVLSLSLEPVVDWLTGVLPPLPDGVWVVLELAVVGVLVVWGVRRVRRGPSSADDKPETTSRRVVSVPVLLAGGAAFALTALTDPTYYAVIVLAGRGEPLWLVVLAHLLWFVVSQSPLLALSLATLTGGHERIAEVLQRWWSRGRSVVGRLVTVAIFLAAAVLAADVGGYLVTGEFLIG